MSFAGTKYEADYKIADHFRLWESVVSSDHPDLASRIVLSELDLLSLRVLFQSIIEPVRKFIGFPFRWIDPGREYRDRRDPGGKGSGRY